MTTTKTTKAAKAEQPTPAPAPVGPAGWTHRLIVDGADHWLVIDELTALDEIALRHESSLAFEDVFGLGNDGKASLSKVAGLIFLAERQAGKRTSFREIAAGLTLGAEFTMEHPDEPDDQEVTDR